MNEPIAESLAYGLNALALLAISGILIAAFYAQIVQGGLPCPLCLLQRVGFVIVGLGLSLNLLERLRPGHYALMIMGAALGGAISLRQVFLHIVPGSGAYGDPVFGLHLYSWAALIFAAVIVGASIMLLVERQFATGPSPRAPAADPRLVRAGLVAVAVFAIVVLGNGVSTVLECGAGLCPDDPSGYELLGRG